MRKIRISEAITYKETESIKTYLREISKIELFSSPEAEAECANRASQGDEDAIEELVHRNLRFVISVAKQYSTANIPLGDLINEGNLGLMEAARKFDPTMGNKFISYAVWYIRKDIFKYLCNSERLVRLPQNKVHELSQLTQEISSFENELGRDATPQELKQLPKFKHLTLREVNELLEMASSNTFSLDTPTSVDGESTIGDLLESNMFESGQKNLINEDGRAKLDLLLNKLDTNGRIVLKMYFGVDNFYPMRLNEIGDAIGVSRERVRQIKESSLKKLAKHASLQDFSEMFS